MFNYMKKNITKILLFFCLVSVCTSAFANKVQEYFEAGESAFQRGDLNTAIKNYEKVVNLEPNFAPGYNALGITHARKGAKIEDIMWFFKVATEINPDYLDAHYNMCQIYNQYRNFNKAEVSCLKTLEIDPEYTRAELTLAWLYLLGKSEPAKAVKYFNAVLEKVDNPKIYFGLGSAYVANGDYHQVLDIITTLKFMGENELASKLEKNLRASSRPEAPPSITQLPENQPGALIGQGGQITTTKPPAQASAPAAGSGGNVGIDGLMRIRLKGTLSNPGSSGGKKSPPSHPGSL